MRGGVVGAGERVVLSQWPTPLEQTPRLAVAIGLHPGDLWVKRDDLAGLGGGGNKVRKLEWLAADALAHGADTLVTVGGVQSNHARLTAAAAARLGLDAVLVLPAASRPAQVSGNLALDVLFGARIAWAEDATTPDLLTEYADRVCEDLTQQGARPYLVPFGGSSALGARGYQLAGREIRDQLPGVAHVVTALGSGATMAGLITVLGADRVLGVDVGAIPDPATAAATFATELAGDPYQAAALRMRSDMVGQGYSVLHDPVLDAIRAAAAAEGLILDPVYTARALAGLTAAVRDGHVTPGQTTVLLHTGGLPGLFGHAQALIRTTALLQTHH